MVSEDDKGICGISLCTLDECSHNSHSALTDKHTGSWPSIWMANGKFLILNYH
jgi:hypothetical protein